jgi:asparagine synthase (glutamine-hydrolysing)
MGADEAFFGYRRQKAWLYAQRYQRLPAPLRRCVSAFVNRMPVRIGRRGLKSVRWARKFLSFADLEPGAAYRTSFSYYSFEQLRRMLEPPWREGIDSVRRNFDRIFGEKCARDPVNRLCNTDLQLFLPGLNLAYTDRASMALSNSR